MQLNSKKVIGLVLVITGILSACNGVAITEVNDKNTESLNLNSISTIDTNDLMNSHNTSQIEGTEELSINPIEEGLSSEELEYSKPKSDYNGNVLHEISNVKILISEGIALKSYNFYYYWPDNIMSALRFEIKTNKKISSYSIDIDEETPIMAGPNFNPSSTKVGNEDTSGHILKKTMETLQNSFDGSCRLLTPSGEKVIILRLYDNKNICVGETQLYANIPANNPYDENKRLDAEILMYTYKSKVIDLLGAPDEDLGDSIRYKDSIYINYGNPFGPTSGEPAQATMTPFYMEIVSPEFEIHDIYIGLPIREAKTIMEEHADDFDNDLQAYIIGWISNKKTYFRFDSYDNNQVDYIVCWVQ